MRSASNFHPEWGYLAPVPSFMRRVRIVLVSTAIGATAGTVVVASLLATLNNNDTSIAARALIASAPVINSPAPAAPLANSPATAPAQVVLQPSAAANAPSPAPTAATASTKRALDEKLALTPAKVVAGVVRGKESSARNHSRVARNTENGWRYDRGFGPVSQPPRRRLIDEFGERTFPAARGRHLSATRNDW